MTEDERFVAAVRDLERLGSSLLASQSRSDQQQFLESFAFDSTAFDAQAFDAAVTSEQLADLHRSCLAALDLVATWIKPVEPDTWAELTRLRAEFNKYRPAHQRGQQDTVTTLRRRRRTFVQQVDAERTKSDETGFTEAIVRVLKRTGVRVKLEGARKKSLQKLSALTPLQRRRAVDAAKKRYRREKEAR